MHFLFHEWFRVRGWFVIYAIIWPITSYYFGMFWGYRDGRRSRP